MSRPYGRQVRACLPQSTQGWGVLALIATLEAARLLGAYGARLGAFGFPSIPAVYVYGFGALGLLLLPRPRAAPTTGRRFLLVPLLWIAALSCAAFATKGSLSSTPLPAVARFPVDAASFRDQAVEVDFARWKRRVPLNRVGGTRGVTFRLTGFVQFPESGTYTFHARSDGWVRLVVGRDTVLDGRGDLTFTAALPAGERAFTLGYVPESRPAFLDLSWNRPAFFELLPFERYLSKRSNADAPPLAPGSEGRALAALLSWMVLWSLAAGAVVRAWEGRARFPAVGFERWTSSERALFVKPCLGVAVVGLVFLGAIYVALGSRSENGSFFLRSSSEYMMQTVSVADLRLEPFRSLWFLHIQPPLFDFVRAVLAQFFQHVDELALIERVDDALRILWWLSYAGMGALLCLWLCRLTRPAVAIAAAVLFLLHPAAIAYATYLDTTFLTALGVLWLTYVLSGARGGGGSPAALAGATLWLFLMRPIFQWPFLAVVAAAFVLAGATKRQLLHFTVVVGVVMGAYVAKQYYVFGVATTSTFAGYNGARSIGADLAWDLSPPLRRPLTASDAAVLAREKKPNGEYNFNQLAYLKISFALWDRYWATLRAQPPSRTLRAYMENLQIYLEPSSRYVENPFADALPWRRSYDFLTSGAIWLVVLAAAGVGLLRTEGLDLRRALGLALPVFYVAVSSVLFESGENMRFRFFIEPTVYVLLAHQAYRTAIRVIKLIN